MSLRTKLFPRVLCLVFVLALPLVRAEDRQPEQDPAPAKNLVLIIGDGMGAEHIKAASFFLYGKEGALFMESAPYQGTMTTRSASDPVTDSAAAATAMATGHKVNNGVLSLAIPGGGGRLTTLVEHFAAGGRMTGLITTCMIVDATPAGFGAHAAGRSGYAEIAKSMLQDVHTNLLFGGDANKDATRGKVGGIDEAAAKAAGYTVILDRKGLAALGDPKLTHVAGLFGEAALPWEYEAQDAVKQGKANPYDTYPHLSEMTLAALKFLSRAEKGFFLMSEGGRIDPASHQNDVNRMLGETVETDRTVKVTVEWALPRKDTLVVVLADHETGGLQVVKGGAAGTPPEVKWTANIHTGVDVRVFAWGPGAEKFAKKIDNTDIFRIFSGREPYSPKAAQHKPAVPAAAPVPEPVGAGRN